MEACKTLRPQLASGDSVFGAGDDWYLGMLSTLFALTLEAKAVGLSQLRDHRNCVSKHLGRSR